MRFKIPESLNIAYGTPLEYSEILTIRRYILTVLEVIEHNNKFLEQYYKVQKVLKGYYHPDVQDLRDFLRRTSEVIRMPESRFLELIMDGPITSRNSVYSLERLTGFEISNLNWIIRVYQNYYDEILSTYKDVSDKLLGVSNIPDVQYIEQQGMYIYNIQIMGTDSKSRVVAHYNTVRCERTDTEVYAKMSSRTYCYPSENSSISKLIFPEYHI